MSSKLVSALDTLADAINTKTGNTSKMTISGMIDAVERMTVVNGGSATNVTVKADALVSGFTALNNAGAVITGTMPIVTPTMASSVPNAIIVPSGYVNSRHVMSVGSVYKGVTTIMPSVSAVTITSGNYITRDVTVKGDSNLVASNIKDGVTVFNVKGTYAGTGVDTFDADALSTDLLEGKTAYNANGKISGTIKNIDSTYLTITPTSESQIIPAGVYLNEAITVEAVEGTDTSDATVTAGALLSGVTAYGSNGKISGTIPTVSATMAANVITVPAGYIKTAQQLKVDEAKEPTISGNEIIMSSGYRGTTDIYTIGNVYNTAATTITPSTSGLIIPASSYIAHDVTIQGDTDLVASNIKQGVNIFGVAGSYAPGNSTVVPTMYYVSVIGNSAMTGMYRQSPSDMPNLKYIHTVNPSYALQYQPDISNYYAGYWMLLEGATEKYINNTTSDYYINEHLGSYEVRQGWGIDNVIIHDQYNQKPVYTITYGAGSAPVAEGIAGDYYLWGVYGTASYFYNKNGWYLFKGTPLCWYIVKGMPNGDKITDYFYDSDGSGNLLPYAGMYFYGAGTYNGITVSLNTPSS